MAKFPPIVPAKTVTKTTWAHPAAKFLKIALLCLVLAILLGFVTVFVPWSRKNISTTTRVHAYPFQNCAETRNSPLNVATCQDNDFTAATSVSGGSEKCRGFIIATIVNVFIYVLLGIFAAVFLVLALKWAWGKPLVVCAIGVLLLLICLGAAIAAFACWIVYAEEICASNNVLFPLQGYSYGFIMTVVAAFLLLVALLAAILALLTLKKGAVKEGMGPIFSQYPPVPGPTYPAYPSAYPSAYPGINSPYMPAY